MNLFEFYVDGDKFWDPRIDELALEEPELKLTANAAGELTFTIYPSHPKFNSFKPLTSTIEIYRDGQWFWEGRIIDKDGSFENSVTYTVEGALGYLNDSIQPQEEYHELRPIGLVEKLLNIHNSQVPKNRQIQLGAVTVVDPNDALYCTTNFDTTLSCLKTDLIDDLGGYLRLRKEDGTLYLDAIAEPDRTCSQIIEIGKNLIDLAPNFDYKDIASVIIPLGARLEDQETHEEGLEVLDKYVTIESVNGGKNYIARQDLLDLYDQIWTVVRFDNVHTPQNLLRKAREYLTDGQWGEMVIEAKAFDLNYTSEEFQEFRLLDKVRVKSDLHGIDRYFPLTSQTINFNAPENDTITLGGTGAPITITGATNQVTINTKKLDEKIKEPNRLVQQAIYQATELINQGLNGYVRVNGNEILIMDTDDPATAKHVWRWNMGGLGYSNNGYEGPFETAITMDGTIVGKFLSANSVAAEQIDVNYRSSVEEKISVAENNANGYTDGKLKDYWTKKETEVQFQTNTDSILSSVKSTYVSQDEFGKITTRVQSAEQKITDEGIFATINNGIAGNKTIHSTQMSLTKEGLTVDGGNIKILSGDFEIWNDSQTDCILKLDSPFGGGGRCLNVSSQAWFGHENTGYTFIQNDAIYFTKQASANMALQPNIRYGPISIYNLGGTQSYNGLELTAPNPFGIVLDAQYVDIMLVPNTIQFDFQGRYSGTSIHYYNTIKGEYEVKTGYTGLISATNNIRFVHGFCVGIE